MWHLTANAGHFFLATTPRIYSVIKMDVDDTRDGCLLYSGAGRCPCGDAGGLWV